MKLFLWRQLLFFFSMLLCGSNILAQQLSGWICGTTQQGLAKVVSSGIMPSTVTPNPSGNNFKVAALYFKTSDDDFDTGDCQTAGWDTASASPSWIGLFLITTPFNASTVQTDTAAKPNSLTTYYYRMSNGNLWLYGDEHVYTGPSLTKASEAENQPQWRANNQAILQWYINNYDLTSLDNDGDGDVDMIMLICRARAKFGCTGIAADYFTGTLIGSSGESVIVGSTSLTTNSGTYQTDCYNLDGAQNLTAHEIGHHLFLLYGHFNGPHRWNLMSGAGGLYPPRASGVTMSAFEKNQLEWLSYQDLNVTTFDISLSNLTQSNSAIRIPITGSSHYFIVENRQYSNPFERDPSSPGFCLQTSQTIPGTGLLVSYRDATEATIRPADGNVAIVNGYKNGDSSDLFPNGGITQITPYTNPNTNTSSGSNTHIAIKNIHYSGSNIVFDV